ncbi:hypothetical protein [Methylocystis sp. B8]|uniref:hypothetical protein n=1 Tax=Methylocystis sp. B8 TaxID=544938 RepID=UPI0010FE56A7|nr:hypothetical protein [Methylocystis sp. B8]TLG71421.1 hypothetical protein FEV16_15975 [Methylocystis sp. B8]
MTTPKRRSRAFIIARVMQILMMLGVTAVAQLSMRAHVFAAERDVYVSPEGAGSRNGHAPTDAMTLQQGLQLARTGSNAIRLLLTAGKYDVSALGSAHLQTQADSPLTIEGAGLTTVLVGGYRPGASPDSSLFVLWRGNVTFRNFMVRNVARLIAVPNGGTPEGVVVSDIAIRDVYDGIVIDRGKELLARDWRIENLDISGYVRVGIRLAGPRTQRIAIHGAVIDGGGVRADNNCYKAGIQLYEAVSDVTIEDVSIANNIACAGPPYQQGDGIEADDKQGAPQRIALRRVVSTGNRDGAFDLKAKDMTLEDLFADSAGVSRSGFRFWGYPYICIRCRVAGDKSDFQLNNAKLLLRDPPQADALAHIRCNDRKELPSSVYQVEIAGNSSGELVCR